jgi:hypothetical protein
MGRVLTITKLNFLTLFKVQLIICAAVFGLHILISVAVIRIANIPGPAAGGDIIALIYMIVLGIMFFPQGFRYALSRGISRKTYFLAGSLSIIVLAIILALLAVIFYAVNLRVSNVWMVFQSAYPGQNILSMAVWEFGALLFLGVLAWLICLIYYLGNTKTNIFTTVIPFILAPVFIFFNALAHGAIGRAIWQFLRSVMGYSGISPNPYIGTASLLVAAVILIGGIFLFLRRAPVKD